MKMRENLNTKHVKSLHQQTLLENVSLLICLIYVGVLVNRESLDSNKEDE